MKRAFCLALCSLIGLSGMPAAAVSADTAEKCILIHADTGAVLYEKSADERSLIASTTKIMTALVVLENCSLDAMVRIKPEWAGIEGSSMYIKAGDTYTVRQLLYGLLLVSGNDAAAALAGYTAGSQEAFAHMMNEKARSLGLENTSFSNPHGLDAENHYSTARDMALIMCEAMGNSDFVEIGSARSFTIGELTYVNHNKLLRQYPGCIGGKTGYTMACGRSLVSCAERDGMRLVCVTLSDPDDWNTHTRLYDWAFENFSYESIVPLFTELKVPLISGHTDYVEVGCLRDSMALLPRTADYSIRIELPGFVYAPIKQGETLGRITVRMDGVELGSADLCAAEAAPRDDTLKLTPWERFRLTWYRTNKLGAFCPAFRSMI